ALLTLIDDLEGCDVVAPMAMHHSGRFYDTWGYRKSGQPFAFYPPYHPDFRAGELMEMDTAGSCLAMRAEVARRCRMQRQDAVVGFCRDARERGYRIWLDTRVQVTHPPDGT